MLSETKLVVGLNGGGAVHKAAKLTAAPLTKLQPSAEPVGPLSSLVQQLTQHSHGHCSPGSWSLLGNTVRISMSEHSSALQVEAMESQQEMRQVGMASKV